MCDQVMMGHTARVTSLEMISGSKLISGSSDTTLAIWDTITGKQIQKLGGHMDAINQLSLLNETTLASCSNDMTVRLWDLNESKCILTARSDKGNVFCCSLSNDVIYYGSNSGSFVALDIKSGKQLQTFDAGSASILSCAIDKNTSIAYVGDHNGYIRSFNLSTNKKISDRQAHKGKVSCLQIRGDFLYSGSFDGTIIEWNTKKEEVNKKFEKIAMSVHCLHATDSNIWAGYDDEVLYSWPL